MPNVSSGKYIVDKIRQGGFAPHEIETDQILQRFINQIAPEQKISWGDPNNEHKGYIGLSAPETESFIYQILGEQTTISINSSLFSKMCGHSDDIGLSPTVQRRMHDSGIVLFDILFPEGDYISNNILVLCWTFTAFSQPAPFKLHSIHVEMKAVILIPF